MLKYIIIVISSIIFFISANRCKANKDSTAYKNYIHINATQFTVFQNYLVSVERFIKNDYYLILEFGYKPRTTNSDFVHSSLNDPIPIIMNKVSTWYSGSIGMLKKIRQKKSIFISAELYYLNISYPPTYYQNYTGEDMHSYITKISDNIDSYGLKLFFIKKFRLFKQDSNFNITTSMYIGTGLRFNFKHNIEFGKLMGHSSYTPEDLELNLYSEPKVNNSTMLWPTIHVVELLHLLRQKI